MEGNLSSCIAASSPPPQQPFLLFKRKQGNKERNNPHYSCLCSTFTKPVAERRPSLGWNAAPGSTNVPTVWEGSGGSLHAAIVLAVSFVHGSGKPFASMNPASLAELFGLGGEAEVLAGGPSVTERHLAGGVTTKEDWGKWAQTHS